MASKKFVTLKEGWRNFVYFYIDKNIFILIDHISINDECKKGMFHIKVFKFQRKIRIWERQIQLICALMMFKLQSLEYSHVGKNILGSSSSSKTACKNNNVFFPDQ